METKSCFFLGHRQASEEIGPALRAAVEKHITEDGVLSFYVGHYGDFDRLAAKAALSVKENYPGVTLTLLLPYHPAERPVKKPDGFDATFYPPGMETVSRRYAITRANRYMIDHSDFLICYVWQAASHARDLVEYAQRREKKGLISVCKLSGTAEEE